MKYILIALIIFLMFLGLISLGVSHRYVSGDLYYQQISEKSNLNELLHYSLSMLWDPMIIISDSLPISLLQDSNPVTKSSIYATTDIATRQSFNNASFNYENPTHNLRMNYPSAWKEIVSDENNVTFISPLENNQDSFQERLVITVFPSGNVPLEEMVSLRIIEFKQNIPGFEYLDSRRDTIAGNPAYKILYNYEEGEKFYKVTQMWTIVGDKIYSIAFIADVEKYPNYLSEVQQILDSIEIQGMTTKSMEDKSNYPELEIASDPYDIVVDPTINRLYIPNYRFHTVSVVDSTTDQQIAEIPVGRFPTAVDVNTDTNNVYVTNSRSNTVSVIDGLNNKKITDITVGNKPVAVAVDKTEKGIDSLAFVANEDSDTVSIVDATKNELIAPKELAVEDEPSSLTVNSVTNRLYVANRGSDTVSVIDYLINKEGKLENTTVSKIKVQDYPTSIAINPDSNKIYVANYYSNSISIIDGSTNAVYDNVSVGVNPTSIAINPDSNKIYVANYGSDTVSVLEGSTNTIVANVTVGGYPNTVYRNPISDIIYVINVGSNTVSQIRNASLLAGVTFNVNPSSSGYLDCNGKMISELEYIRYETDTEIKCVANSNSDYIFRSWSSDFPFKSGITPVTTFTSSDYGNVTANFQVPVEVTLPREYWQQLYVVVLGAIIPAIAGWSIPTIAGWINRKQQRKVLRECMTSVTKIHQTFSEDKSRHSNELEKVRSEIVNKLTEGKISESQYDILNNRISTYLKQ